MDVSPHDVDRAGLKTGRAVRLACRDAVFSGATSGLAPGYAQANLVVLPADLATDFLRFCQRNPKPCPLLGVSEPGALDLPDLAADLDLRTDLPGYRVWREGELVAEPADVRDWWRDDLVAFAIGCSYTFEAALLAEGMTLRHVARGSEVPMFRTNIDCAPAGRFFGHMVVSMRPFRPLDAIRAIQITSRYPGVHGAPVHIGLPEMIGIRDLAAPDYGAPVAVLADELPVFWACGVTPQAVIAAIRPPFAITHQPGRMLVLDLPDHRCAVL